MVWNCSPIDDCQNHKSSEKLTGGKYELNMRVRRNTTVYIEGDKRKMT